MSIETQIIDLGFLEVDATPTVVKATANKGGYVASYAVKRMDQDDAAIVALFKAWISDDDWKEPRSPSFDELKRDK